MGKEISRRSFLKTGTAAAIGLSMMPGKVFAKGEKVAPAPLNRKLNKLARLITNASYTVAALVVIGRVIAYFIYTENPALDFDFLTHLLQSVMIAVTLIVVAVPEGLPMAVTLSLAYSMRRMLNTNNLVRRLHACETMGATTVICTDKTGTLTQNQMHVNEALFYALKDNTLDDSQFSTIISESIAANSTAHLSTEKEKVAVIGNPTEGALLLWLKDQGVDYANVREHCELLADMPFDTERKYMATVVRSETLGEDVLYVKGAPEIVYNMCSNTCGDVDYATISEQLQEFQSKAMRTLGFAYKVLDQDKDDEKAIDSKNLDLNGLTFLGIVADRKSVV